MGGLRYLTFDFFSYVPFWYREASILRRVADVESRDSMDVLLVVI